MPELKFVFNSYICLNFLFMALISFIGFYSTKICIGNVIHPFIECLIQMFSNDTVYSPSLKAKANEQRNIALNITRS